MGQKVNPVGLRLGINRTWDSRWFLKKGYAKQLLEDLNVRKMIKEKLAHAGVSKVEIERPGQKLKVKIQLREWDATVTEDSPFDPTNARIRIDG